MQLLQFQRFSWDNTDLFHSPCDVSIGDCGRMREEPYLHSTRASPIPPYRIKQYFLLKSSRKECLSTVIDIDLLLLLMRSTSTSDRDDCIRIVRCTALEPTSSSLQRHPGSLFLPFIVVYESLIFPFAIPIMASTKQTLIYLLTISASPLISAVPVEIEARGKSHHVRAIVHQC